MEEKIEQPTSICIKEKKYCNTNSISVVVFKDYEKDSFSAVPILWNFDETKYKDFLHDKIFVANTFDKNNFKNLEALYKDKGEFYNYYEYGEYLTQLKKTGYDISKMKETYIKANMLFMFIKESETQIKHFPVSKQIKERETMEAVNF